MNPDLLNDIYDQAELAKASNNSLMADLKLSDGRYSELEFKTSGGMKSVYTCHDSHTDRRVILVTPKSSDLNEKFVREGRLNSFLQHPNIMAVYDVGLLRENEPFFTMKWLEGRDLDVVLKADEKLPLNKLVDYFIKACEGVNYAHSRGVIHLDLKPENIRIGDFGEVVVCDWGISELNSEIDDKQNSFLDKDLQKLLLYGEGRKKNSLKGTPGFIAPERFSACELDQRHDVYAMGAVLYEILTGQAPEQLQPKMSSIKLFTGAFHKTKAPVSLVAICQKAMQVNPDNRYACMSDMLNDLVRYTHGFSTEAEQAGLARQISLLYLRNQRFCHLLMSSVLCLSLVIILAFIEVNKSRSLAVQEKELALEAKERVQKLNIELEEKERARQVFLKKEAQHQLYLANQKLNKFQMGEMERALKLASQLASDNPEVQLFQAEYAFAELRWAQALEIYKSLGQEQVIDLIGGAQKFTSRDVLENVSAFKKVLRKHFLILFLRNQLKLAEDLEVKKELYRWILIELHQGLKVRPELEVRQTTKGVEVIFTRALAVKNLGPIRLLNPVKLDLSNTGLIYESGINDCVNLEELNLSGTGLLGLGKLKLDKLKVLNISKTPITSSEKLSGITQLRDLDISFSRLAYFEGLKQLEKLETIRVDSSQLTAVKRVLPHVKIVIKK